MFQKYAVAFFLLIATALAASGSYTVIVSPEGNSLVIAEFSTTQAETQNVPLPLDATDFRVTGAIYVPSSNGIDLSLTTTESAIVIFNSNLLVTGSGDNYRFSLDLPLTESTVTVSLPKNAVVQTTTPQGQVTQTGSAVNVIWSGVRTASVSIQYTLGAAEGGWEGQILLIVAVVIIIIVAFFLLMKFKKKV